MQKPQGGLAAALNDFMTSLMDRVDPRTSEILRQNADRLARSGIADRAIGTGDRAPDFSLIDQFGRTVGLHETLGRGPVVMLFVRGGWCPFCAITLRAFDSVRTALAHESATLLAITPTTPEHVQTTVERNVLHYTLLSDPGLTVAERYGLVWEPEPQVQAVYARLGHDIPSLNGTTDWRLPIPAGYVIGRNGIVAAARIDPRLTHRLLPDEALAAVKSLAKT